MGWAAGSILMNAIIGTVRINVPNPVVRRRIYRDLVKVFDEHDWDTHGECLGVDPTFDDVLDELHPGILDEDTDEEDEGDADELEEDDDDEDEEDEDEEGGDIPA
jgi:hypothetical protein